MRESYPALPKFEKTDRCLSPGDLFTSPKFQTFLEIYNRKNNTAVRVKDIINDYNLANDVWRFAQNCKVAGGSPMRVAADICSLVGEILAEVKDRDTERTLSAGEVMERFEELGIDIEAIRESVECHNKAEGYEGAMKNAGALQPGESYGLPLPSLTEFQMRKLEDAVKNFKVDAVYIDDRRLNDAETYAMFFNTANSDKKRKIVSRIDASIPLTAAHFIQNEKGAAENADYEKTTRYSLEKEVQEIGRIGEGEVRIIAYRRNAEIKGLEPMGQMSGQSLASSFTDGNDRMEPVSLGTYLRLSRYVRDEDPELWEKMNQCYVRDGHGAETYESETLLNNMDPSGNALLVTRDNGRGQMGLKWVNPADSVPMRTVKKVLVV